MSVPGSSAGTDASPLTRAIRLGRKIHDVLTREGHVDLGARCRKEYSCRKLARLHRVPASTLWRALAIYQLSQRHPELADCHHVGVGHLSVLLGIPREHQLYFLRRAESSRWSRAQLERQIRRLEARSQDTPPLRVDVDASH
jgi:hypothetical protein